MAKQKVIELFPGGAPSEEKKRDKPKGQRKDGLVQVTKSFGRLPNGKRDVKVFYGKTMKEAKAKRDEYIKEREEGLVQEDKDITVSEWVDRWKSLYRSNLEFSNEKNYQSHMKRLKNCRIGRTTLGDMRMADVREAHLHKALYETEGMSNSTIQKYNMIIKQIFSKARRNKVIRDDPSEDLDLPEGTAESHRALERWEADCILSNYFEHRTGLWVMIMMLAGLRSGELFALKWSSVDLDNRELTVKEAAERKNNQVEDKDTTKTEAGMRTLPICDPLYDAFMRVPVSDRIGYVALSAKEEQLTLSAFRRGMSGFLLAMTRVLRGEPVKQQGRRPKPVTSKEKALEAQKPKMDFRPHDLRHTFATILYDAGVDVKSAQYYLGHNDISTTMNLYTHLSKEKEKKARVALVGFLDNWLKVDEKKEGENAPENEKPEKS